MANHACGDVDTRTEPSRRGATILRVAPPQVFIFRVLAALPVDCNTHSLHNQSTITMQLTALATLALALASFAHATPIDTSELEMEPEMEPEMSLPEISPLIKARDTLITPCYDGPHTAGETCEARRGGAYTCGGGPNGNIVSPSRPEFSN